MLTSLGVKDRKISQPLVVPLAMRAIAERQIDLPFAGRIRVERIGGIARSDHCSAHRDMPVVFGIKPDYAVTLWASFTALVVERPATVYLAKRNDEFVVHLNLIAELLGGLEMEIGAVTRKRWNGGVFHDAPSFLASMRHTRIPVASRRVANLKPGCFLEKPHVAC